MSYDVYVSKIDASRSHILNNVLEMRKLLSSLKDEEAKLLKNMKKLAQTDFNPADDSSVEFCKVSLAYVDLNDVISELEYEIIKIEDAYTGIAKANVKLEGI